MARSGQLRERKAMPENDAMLGFLDVNTVEEIPRSRREATPYDLKLEILGQNIRDMRRDDGRLAEVADHLCDLANEFIEILEKRERWNHFHSPIEMPCPEFLIPIIEIDVED